MLAATFSPHVVLQSLVETAMLAAVSGLAFTLATLLKLESYLGYFLPMPVIVAAMRSGPASGRKTMTATCFLLLRKPSLHQYKSINWTGSACCSGLADVHVALGTERLLSESNACRLAILCILVFDLHVLTHACQHSMQRCQ